MYYMEKHFERNLNFPQGNLVIEFINDIFQTLYCYHCYGGKYYGPNLTYYNTKAAYKDMKLAPNFLRTLNDIITPPEDDRDPYNLGEYNEFAKRFGFQEYEEGDTHPELFLNTPIFAEPEPTKKTT